MLTDKQSLLLCGLTASGIFIAGILDILNNFIVLTILTLIFFAVIGNLLYIKMNPKEDDKKELENQNDSI
ncbi:hypothetical protein Q4Q35_08430 [Flavivirga aquimarina]|uniref:Uncharacterized protein n=1 Tax=Flavivirga aquimarina TaxID=2027862 RepID=A0ABT8W9U0_9FLAO|nr:hypothetical protein [Flavivirga aquimarina]MDO5969832.1 hypothetical protein [Flavivirga aquimarina]